PPYINKLIGLERSGVERDHQIRAAGDDFRPAPAFGDKFVGFIEAVWRNGCGIVKHVIPSSDKFSISSRGGSRNRVNDFDIASTAAQISGNRFFDFVTSRMRIGVEQISSGNEHAWSADAALRRATFQKGLLQRVELAIARQSFNGKKPGAL